MIYIIQYGLWCEDALRRDDAFAISLYFYILNDNVNINKFFRILQGCAQLKRAAIFVAALKINRCLLCISNRQKM